MALKQPIAESLISCRNILLNGYANEHVLPCLLDVLTNLDSIAIVGTRKIVERCVSEVIDQVKGANFVSAGWILNLIHNLPLDESGEQRWDVDYFLSMELPTVLDHFDEIKSAREIILYVCKQIANRYLPGN